MPISKDYEPLANDLTANDRMNNFMNNWRSEMVPRWDKLEERLDKLESQLGAGTRFAGVDIRLSKLEEQMERHNVGYAEFIEQSKWKYSKDKPTNKVGGNQADTIWVDEYDEKPKDSEVDLLEGIDTEEKYLKEIESLKSENLKFKNLIVELKANAAEDIGEINHLRHDNEIYVSFQKENNERKKRIGQALEQIKIEKTTKRDINFGIMEFYDFLDQIENTLEGST